MKKLLMGGIAAAVLAAGLYFSGTLENLYYNFIPENGVLQADDAVKGVFEEVEPDIVVQIIELDPKVEPHSVDFVGDELYFLGKGLENDRYDGTVGLYKVNGVLEEGRIEVELLDSADLQRNEWSGLHSLGDVLIWTKSHRLDWENYSYEKAGYHRETGYVELPKALQNAGGQLMQWENAVYWFDINKLMMWEEGSKKSKEITKSVFRYNPYGGELQTPYIAYNKGDGYIIRMDLNKNRPLDKYQLISHKGAQNVLCTEKYIVFSNYDGEVFLYDIEGGTEYFISGDTDPNLACKVHFDDGTLILLRGNCLEIYDLNHMTVQTAELPEMKYTDFIYTEGQILACSDDGRCFVRVAY